MAKQDGFITTPAPLATGQALQQGGTHYADLPIDPITYATLAKLNPMEFSVVKYVTRHRRKDREGDLKKAFHFLQMLMEHEYGIVTTVKYENNAPVPAHAEAPRESHAWPTNMTKPGAATAEEPW